LDVSLKPRERVLMALRHEKPDRVPIDLAGTVVSGIHVLAYKNLAKSMDLYVEENIVDIIQQLAAPSEELLRSFESDFRSVYARPPRAWSLCEKLLSTGRPYFVDEWGVSWGKTPYYYDMIDHPLKNATTIKDLEDYTWPDSHAPGRLDGLHEEVKRLNNETDFAIVAGMSGPIASGGLFEEAWWLRGLEKFLVDLGARPEFANALLDKILDLHLQFYDEYLSEVGEYVQLVEWGDDYGMQTGPIMSPNLFRKYFKPRIKKFFDLVKSKTNAKIFLHSCGCVYPFIEDLIEAGVDILNPVQPLAKDMDHQRLKEQFGSRLCFHGGLDTQQLLPRGRPTDVADGVKRVISHLAPDGGYIFAAAHNIQADVPPENIHAMFNTAKNYGAYPTAT
jgi:uroporphyrinogen decarboxylase